MSEHVRIRLRFDSVPVSYARKCWFTFNGENCRLVGDVAHLIASHFNLQDAQGIQLYMDDYLIPTDETSKIIRDNDTIQVKKLLKSLESSSSDESSDNVQTKIQRVSAQGSSDRTDRSKKLVGITKKTASGGLHTKFQSSSSSSSSSDDSTSSSSNSNNIPNKSHKKNLTLFSRPLTQWDVKKKGSVTVGGLENTNGSGTKEKGTTNKRKKFNRRGNLSNCVVGGPRDILSTKSTLYTSPSAKVINSGSVNDVLSLTKDRKNHVISKNKEPVITNQAKNGEQSNGCTESCETESSNPLIHSIIEPPIEDIRDYTTFPDLQGPPRVGDKLAFKVLELSSNYTPEVSEFMEAEVLKFDPSTTTVRLKYTEAALMKLSQKFDVSKPGKFTYEQDAENMAPLELRQEIDISLNEILEPKLIPPNQ